MLGNLEQEVVEAALDVGEGGADAATSGCEVQVLRGHGVELFADPFDGLPRRHDGDCRPLRGSRHSAPPDRVVASDRPDRGSGDRHESALRRDRHRNTRFRAVASDKSPTPTASHLSDVG